MRALEVLQTTDWISSITEEFRAKLRELTVTGMNTDLKRIDLVGRSMVLIHAHGRVVDTLKGNPSAVAVLTAWGLEAILLETSPLLSSVTQLLSVDKTERYGEGFEDFARMHHVINRFLADAVPWRRLIVPADLAGKEPLGDAFLTINLERDVLELGVVRKVLADLESLYQAVNQISGKPERSSLQIVKIESGSSLSINLKGIGEPIKQLKQFVLEVWTKHRHKRADEILDRHRVMASGIHLIDQIDKRVQKDVLSTEDGNRLKRVVLKDTLSLFSSGALIEEIPVIEKVNNLALLSSFGPKLLSAPLTDGNPNAVSDALLTEQMEDLPVQERAPVPPPAKRAKAGVPRKKKSKTLPQNNKTA